MVEVAIQGRDGQLSELEHAPRFSYDSRSWATNAGV
jgi:hypothetical protein